MSDSIHFSWRRDDVTPELLQVVGAIVLEWAMIDHEIAQMCNRFWMLEHSERKLPQSFNKRARILKEYCRKLYSEEYPEEMEEFRLLCWFLQRLMTANGKRDDIAHGQPGQITKGGRTYEGLHVPSPGNNPRFVPMSISDLQALSWELLQLETELIQVSNALYKAQAAASPNTHRERVDGVWTELTKANRNPKLPRAKLPPPTFRE